MFDLVVAPGSATLPGTSSVGYARVSTDHQNLAAQTEAGVLLKSLREGIDCSTATGKMLAGILAFLAGYERELMHERAAAARARGRHTGRPPRLNAEQVRQVRSLRGGGEAIADPAATFAVSRATIYRALHQDIDDGSTADLLDRAGRGAAASTSA